MSLDSIILNHIEKIILNVLKISRLSNKQLFSIEVKCSGKCIVQKNTSECLNALILLIKSLIEIEGNESRKAVGDDINNTSHNISIDECTPNKSYPIVVKRHQKLVINLRHQYIQ
jgi:hypothetical protein